MFLTIGTRWTNGRWLREDKFLGVNMPLEPVSGWVQGVVYKSASLRITK